MHNVEFRMQKKIISEFYILNSKFFEHLETGVFSYYQKLIYKHILLYFEYIFYIKYFFMKPNKDAPCKERWCSFCCDLAWIVWRYPPDISNITDTT